MISVTDKGSGVDIGSITEPQLQVLVRHLEETDVDDQDFVRGHGLHLSSSHRVNVGHAATATLPTSHGRTTQAVAPRPGAP